MTATSRAAARHPPHVIEVVQSAASTGIGFTVAAAVVLTPFVFLGVVNGDEGWYTVSSRLAAQGQLPYRDFAFTQGPVFLYLLAPFERVLPGVITARIVSATCAAVGIGLILVVAHRLAGQRAVLYSGALLLAATPSLPYWLALTKTYGVASLFVALTLYALTSSAAPSRRLPAAVAGAIGFAVTRPSAVIFALAIVAVAVAVAPNLRSRISIAGVAALCTLPLLVFVTLAPSAALWGLFEYHELKPGTPETPWAKLFGRTFDVMRAWPGPTLLVVFAAIVLTRDNRTRRRLHGHPEMVAAAGGLVSFLVLHELGAWFWAEEYVVPVLPSVIVLAVSTLVVYAERLGPTTTTRRGRRERAKWAYQSRTTRHQAAGPSGIQGWHVTVALVLCLGVTAVTGGHDGYIREPGWSGAPSADHGIAQCVAENSKPGDRVLALFFADVVAAAHRMPVERASMGIFSYQDVSSRRAQELHILNASALLDVLSKQQPKVIVLSDLDTAFLTLAGYFSARQIDSRPFGEAIDKNYRVACRGVATRQIPNGVLQVVVFVRKH